MTNTIELLKQVASYLEDEGFTFVLPSEPTVFDEKVYETLVVFKQEIQNVFNATLTAYQKPYRSVSKLNDQYIMERDVSKRLPDEKKLENIQKNIDILLQEAEDNKPAFMRARRSEEYFRAIPEAYRTQNPKLWALVEKDMLRTQLWAHR
jgi:hypothetical protein